MSAQNSRLEVRRATADDVADARSEHVHGLSFCSDTARIYLGAGDWCWIWDGQIEGPFDTFEAALKDAVRAVGDGGKT